MSSAKAAKVKGSGQPSGGGTFDAQTLGRLVESLESSPDQKFLHKVVKEAAEVVGADIAFISRLSEGTIRMETLALYDRAGQIEDMVYELPGTPCEQVIARGEACIYASGVAESFPDDPDLVDLGVEGYVAVPLKGADGSLLGLFCTLYKAEVQNPEFAKSLLQLFSARIAGEIERTEAEERVSLALDGAADGIWDWNIETGRVHTTFDFFRRLGCKEDEFPTTVEEWEAWSHPEDLDGIRAASLKHIKDNTPVDVKARFRVSDGEYRWVRLRGKAQRDSDGNAVRILGSLSDIDDLVRAQIDAEKANEAKSLFLANMSHEIRTPMNAIMGMLQVLADSEVSGDQREWIDTANSAAVSLLTVLNDILDLSRLEAGKVEIEKSQVCIRDFTSDIERAFAPLADQKSLRLVAHVAETVPQVVETDPTRLRQILSNLLSNAIKFTADGQVELKVEAFCRDDANVVRFSVRDTGIGIAEKVQKRLFERFEQADNSTTRQFGGTGLGLAICRELATRLEGTVGVDSKLGEGSCFWFELPFEGEIPQKSESSSPLEKADQSGKPLAGVKALIAEDNPTNQRILQLLMNAFGAEVEIVSNGVEAVERVQQEAFDLILMDVSMPEMDGYEATKAIRALEHENSGIPILAVTAHAMGGELEKALAIGMNGYVSKPIEAANLIASVQEALGNGSSV